MLRFFIFIFLQLNRIFQNQQNLMTSKLQQKYKQIFEVKIHEERLCQLLESFSIKIHNLQQSNKSIKSNLSMSNILDEVKKYVKTIIKEESTQTIYRFYQKIENCNKDISRIEYSYKLFEKNIRDQLDRLNQKEKILEKTIAYVTNNGMVKIQSEIEQLKKQNNQNKDQLIDKIHINKDKINQISEKIISIDQTLQNGQEKIEYLQEIINRINKKGQAKPVEINNNKIDLERDKNNNILMKKSRTSYKKTIHKSFDQFKEKDKNVTEEYKERKVDDITTINKKIESLENKVSIFIQNTQNQRESLISTQQFAQLSKFSSNKIIDRTANKPSPLKKQNNHKRGSIRTEQNRQFDYVEESSKFRINDSSNEIRKINEKLISILSKYTILEENYLTVISRINKLGNLQANIQLKIDQVQKIRVDTNTINEIKLRFKQIQTSMELQELRYVNHSTYQKQIENINKKIIEIDSKLPKLAKKQEVIAAFNFVQNKIKQIILVLSDKFEEDKMGAINKIQNIKCLTCNRQTNLTDIVNNSQKIHRKPSQVNRFSLDRQQIVKRMKSQQNQ